MSTDTAPRQPLDLTVRAALDGWPVDIHLSLPAEKVGAALARLAALGYSPRAETRPAEPRNQGPATCPTHGTAKVRDGKYGPYCSAKLPDGSYCREKPC